jgi:asparagine synthase (glutamine-hydrolysing)
MCGYVFVTSRNKNIRLIDPKYLRYRGPDYSEEVDLGWCRFRHWRLSIQDLTSHSNQPYSDGRDYLIYNGEIYDYRNVGLCNFSKTFSSDTQLIFHALKNKSFELIKNESGFYSFVFIKNLQKTFFSARDYFGKKPLYYYFDDDLLIIASEDRAVRDIAREYGKTITLNASSIAYYLRFKDLYFGKTFYEGVLELPPGSTLDFDFKKWQLLKSRSWEDYYHSKPFYKQGILDRHTSEDNVSQFKKHLISSIKKRFNADVPVQLALSGGIDSTLVALIAKHKKIPFHRALTVSSSSRPSELIKSKTLCEKFQITQKVINFDEIDVLDLLKKAIYAQGCPLSHPHALAMFALTQETRNKGKVLISGEGGDELMYGYDHYKNNNSTFAFLEHIKPSDYFDINSDNKKDLLKDLSWNKYLENNDFRDLDIKTHLLSLLRRNDRVSMQNSVEVRSAYLDFQLFQYVVRQQENGSLIKSKDVLLDIVRDLYKNYKADEDKIGFYVPFDDWFKAQRGKNKLIEKYIHNAKVFFELNFNWTLKKSVHINEKFAWILLNIGLFLELEGEIK